MINCVSSLVPTKCVQNNKSDVSFGMTKVLDPKSLKIIDEFDNSREYKHLGNFATRVMRKEFQLKDIPEKQSGKPLRFESESGDILEYDKEGDGKLTFHSVDILNPRNSRIYVTEKEPMKTITKTLYEFIIEHLV